MSCAPRPSACTLEDTVIKNRAAATADFFNIPKSPLSYL
jgi:hypothetical protein